MKNGFYYEGNELVVDGVSFSELAKEYGTPLYVYSASTLKANYQRIAKALSKLDVAIAYSVKSNSNLSILRLLAAEGACFDIVSGGELLRVQKAGIDPSRVIFAGVGKTVEEMRAALKAGVREFNLESEMEAERLNDVAASMKKIASVAIRINPNVDAKTHKYITTGKSENKFGVSFAQALALSRRIGNDLSSLRLDGFHCHVGSQILDQDVHLRVVNVVADFIRQVIEETGAELKTLNFGGGFGIAYEKGQKPLNLSPFAKAVAPLLKEFGVQLVVEPGRSISGPAGVLLSEVQYIKHSETKVFVIINGSMTDLMRPTLYQAHHEMKPVEKRRGKKAVLDIVGPVCETGDFLALGREGVVPHQGDLLALMDAGAYGFVMSSNYNTRPRAAEILVDNGVATVIRKRETYRDLLKNEIL